MARSVRDARFGKADEFDESKLLVDRVALSFGAISTAETKTIARPVRLRSGRAERPTHLI
jgi:hypothetical protein